ncbi:MAG: DUF2834 domain-containing protein [Chitinophagales bacterium]
MKRKHVYLLLSILGISCTWYYNIQFFLTEADTSMTNFIALTVTTFPAKSIAMDISVVAIAFFVWYIPESIHLKIKYWWIFIPLTFLIALAFAFPLFLYVREVKIEKIQNG